MKTKLIFILLFINLPVYSQCTWTTPIRITDGYVDRNPSFASLTMMYSYGDEYLVFERHVGNITYICTKRFNVNGPADSIIIVSPTSYLNINPSVDYRFNYNGSSVIFVWQSNKNGNWDIYGKFYYPISNTWSQIFAIDTSLQNETNPKIIFSDTSTFNIVYERNSDIIYRKYTSGVYTETNLTLNEPAVCQKPFITLANYYSIMKRFVTYEKVFSNNQKAIYYIVRNDTTGIWSSPDTIAYAGINNNIGFAGTFYSGIICLFERASGNHFNIFATRVPTYGGSFYQDSVVISNSGSNSGFVCNTFPAPVLFSLPWMFDAYGYIYKIQDTTYLQYGMRYVTKPPLYLGDSSRVVKLALNRGIEAGWFAFRSWLVWNKDSAGYSMLYTMSHTQCNEVKKLSNELPTNFSLSQNYPNPFNPSTKISFSIPLSRGLPAQAGVDGAAGRGVLTKLVIYNIQGKEIAALVNQQLGAGTYEIDWNASEYPSGVYFYKLESGDYSETKRMVLLK